jgi:hypothetical protein
MHCKDMKESSKIDKDLLLKSKTTEEVRIKMKSMLCDYKKKKLKMLNAIREGLKNKK